jgi:hypothetical protein
VPAVFVLPKQIPLNAGAVLPGAKLYFYATATSTPQDTYTDEALTVAHANPVVADANGSFAVIYMDPTLPSYRVRLETSAGALVYQVDGIPSNQNTARLLRLESAAPEIILSETDADPANANWRLRVNAEALTLDLGNAAETVWTNVLTIERTASTLDSATLDGDSICTREVGSFTATLSGMTTTTTGTVWWSRNGNLVTIFTRTNSISGTSNSTGMTLTGLPAALQPAQNKTVPCAGLTDSVGGTCTGWADIISSTIIFRLAQVSGAYILSSASAFANVGNKGLAGHSFGNGWEVTYDLT